MADDSYWKNIPRKIHMELERNGQVNSGGKGSGDERRKKYMAEKMCRSTNSSLADKEELCGEK